MDSKEFNELAIEEFGDRVVVNNLHAEQEVLDKLNVTQDDLNDYGETPWIVNGKCPRCEADLGGLFGSFAWGIRHGTGGCTKCKSVSIRYYHYVKEGVAPIKAFALSGF